MSKAMGHELLFEKAIPVSSLTQDGIKLFVLLPKLSFNPIIVIMAILHVFHYLTVSTNRLQTSE